MYECEAENQFKVSKAFINIDESILFNRTTTLLPKYHRTSSYAQIELLLNQTSICTYNFYFILLINIILVNYSHGFYNRR
ncbi:unnamed protein product [Rotaria magnacalcarata]|nr:unnamed protein product [Rotaria magnacalcarata]